VAPAGPLLRRGGGAGVKRLTVAVPTYNRNQVLAENLAGLLPQLTAECRLLVLDNCSDVPVAETLAPLLAGYPGVEAQVVRHRVNIGANANIMRCFELCDTEWLWVLGDDDPVKPDALQTIFRYLNRYPEAMFFNFSVEHHPRRAPVVTRGRREFIDRIDSFGNLIFISTSLYRVDALLPSLKVGYQYTYSMAPQFVVLLQSLKDTGVCYLVDETIVTLIPSPLQEQWSVIDFALGVPILLDLPLDDDSRRALARHLFTKKGESIPLRSLWHQLLLSAVEQGDARSALYLYDRICSTWHRFGAPPGVRALAVLLRVLLRFPRMGHWCVQVEQAVRRRQLPGLQDRARRI
jgi:hypothetical protein